MKADKLWDELQLRIAILQVLYGGFKNIPSMERMPGSKLAKHLNFGAAPIEQLVSALRNLCDKGFIEYDDRGFFITTHGVDHLLENLSGTEPLKFGAFPAVIAKEQARNIAQSTSEEYTESALHKHPALPNSPIGCVARILTVLNPTCGGRCTRMANGPGGIYFACDDSIWCILVDGHLSEYVRIKRDGKIASMRFDAEGAMYVATAQGLIYKIEQNKSGRILAQVGGSLGQAETLLKDVAVGRDYVLVSNYSADAYGIFKIGQDGRYDVLVKGPGSGTQGILIDSDGFLWCVEPSTGCIIKRSISGEELLRTIIASPDDFHASDGYDGSIAIDSLSRLYITIGKVGQVIRIDIATGQKVDTLFSGLNNPTGIACDVTGDLYILESGHNRILKLKMT